MKKGWLWTFLIALVLAKVLFLVSIYTSDDLIFSSPPEECHTLSSSEEGRVNIVFFSDRADAEKYSDYMKTISPFSDNPEKLNFYYIDSYKPECELYKERAILCYSKEIVRKASSCPSDYIVVLKDKERQIRSSSYMNVLSINTQQPLSVFPHEFGHAFANLADEYTPAKLPRSQENCKKDCSEFSGMECYGGCSEESYFRSFNKGIMRTLYSEDYGPYDSSLISKELGVDITPIMTGNIIREPVYCSMQKYYLIEGEYEEGKIVVKSQSIHTGCPGNNGNGAFEYKILTSGGNEVSGNFNPELVFTDNEEGGEVYEYSGRFYLKTPVVDNAESIEIILEEKTISNINLVEEDSLPCPA